MEKPIYDNHDRINTTREKIWEPCTVLSPDCCSAVHGCQNNEGNISMVTG